MKKAEVTERVNKINDKLYAAQVEAEALLDELNEDQGRISDDTVDKVSFLSDAIENARNQSRYV